ncbi:uncharacterized protein LOC106178995 [Lingula anatina]|uniref:Uncharacterized protein LOC106178995 n=1 Tax=Lingula anatina TaxID=7574 RepID=A0A1S3K5I8_LINAN|nr:uncharacterized protein LOC106178995 [Lingula anatina]XP_013417898.1 uncharacterized protein LOC106178995 [Lingula anatina]|eukprot:XP_013417897.1 uncharacterized protein LOC106178995 [Lingula anatina]
MRVVKVATGDEKENTTGAVLLEAPVPCPKPEEALVKVLRAGICATDLEILKGYMGFTGVIGHEFVGVVESAPPSSGFTKGSRVCGDINMACHCDDCTICADRESVMCRNHCPNREVLGILKKDGTYAEYLTLPVCNLHKIPDEITDQEACFVEPLAAACRIVEQGLIKTGDRVAVIGDGKLGLLITEVLATQQCSQLVLFGRHDNKMKLAPPSVERVNVRDRAAEVTTQFSEKFDVVVEACGHPSGLVMAGDLVRPLGTVVLKTTCAMDSAGFNTATFVIKEVKIIGSRCGPFQPAISLLATKKVDVNKLVSKVYPFPEAIQAIQHAGTKGTLKIQLAM